MTKKYFVLLVIIFFLSCDCNKSVKKVDIEKDRRELDGFLSEWHQQAAKADYDAYFGKIAVDGIYIGTDESERWTKDDYIGFAKPFFEKGTTWDFEAKERTISLSDDIKYAWFDELLDTWMGVCIGSGVLKKKENGWEIVHYVLSLKVPNEKMKEVIKIISTEKK